MSETRRTVSVEIVYDGDECDPDCPFIYDMFSCRRFGKGIIDGRCDECKAEDAHAFTVVPSDGSPKYTVTITPDMAGKIKRELAENQRHYANQPATAEKTSEAIPIPDESTTTMWNKLPDAGGLIQKIVYPKEKSLPAITDGHWYCETCKIYPREVLTTFPPKCPVCREFLVHKEET